MDPVMSGYEESKVFVKLAKKSHQGRAGGLVPPVGLQVTVPFRPSWTRYLDMLCHWGKSSQKTIIKTVGSQSRGA
jgi:hypothetical protein